jgi:Tripartite tricarboxylate transporter TctB family
MTTSILRSNYPNAVQALNKRGSHLPHMLLKRDFYAAMVMLLLGGSVAWHSVSYDLGSFVHMGPGMFPFILGLLMGLVGILIMVSALTTSMAEGEQILPENMEWRGWICILAGPLLFILFGKFFGMAAATFACVFVSALGDRTATVIQSAILAAGVTVAGCFLFSVVLNVPFPLFHWGS